MPITCAPCIFAIWPAIDPTLLAAAETQERLARLRLGDLEHADVRGDADVAEHAEHVDELDAFGHHRDRRERVRLHDAVLLPAGQVHERAPERILARGLLVSTTTPTPFERTGSPIATPGM